MTVVKDRFGRVTAGFCVVQVSDKVTCKVRLTTIYVSCIGLLRVRIIQEEVSGIVVADGIVLNKTEFPPFLEMRNEKTYLNTKRNKLSGSLEACRGHFIRSAGLGLQLF